MKTVYNQPNNDTYTEEARELDKKTRQQLKHFVRNGLENGLLPESIEYIMMNAIHMEILAQKHFIQFGKDINGKEVNKCKTQEKE